jgi:P4 family phage/plasmid primase-like protien
MDYKLVLDMLNLLPSKYKERYDKWLNIGIILYNICKDDGLNLWKDYSKESSKYDEKVCEDKYNSLKEGELGMGTLIYYINKGVNKEKLKSFLNKNKDFLEKYKDTPEDIIYKCIDELKILCDNQKFEINNISKVDNEIVATLNDKYCSTCKVEHKGGCNSIVVSKKKAELVCSESNLNRSINTQVNYLQNINNYYTTNYIGNIEDGLVDENYDLVFKDDEKLNELVHNNMTVNHGTSADIVYNINPNKFKYSNNNWYMYNNHRWEKLPDSLTDLKNEIRKIKDLNKIMKHYYKDNVKYLKILQSNDKELGNTNYINGVITECIRYYEDKDFYKIVDNDTNLLGFKNGVYDLSAMIFRDGLPSDNLSIQIEYDFIKNKTDYYKDVIQFFQDIMPNDNDRDYLQKLLGCSLLGENTDQIFNIWTGSGANGKSIINKLLKMVLGDNFTSVNSATLTSMPMSDKPNPEVLVLKNIRLLACQEPSDKRKINTELVKKLTGGDEIVGRYLNSNTIIKFICHFQLIISCNDIPELDKLDGGIRRRLRILDFPTKFVSKPTNNNEMKIDMYLSKKIKNWKSDMLLWMLDGLEKYRLYGLKMTENMLKSTKNYQNEQDIFFDFIKDNLEECKECGKCYNCTSFGDCLENRVFMSDLWDDFKKWYVGSDGKIREGKFNKEIKRHFPNKFKASLKILGIVKGGFLLLKKKESKG